ncbi:cold-shock protein [soil metagenome]
MQPLNEVTGVVRKFSRQRGWGFISPDDGTDTVFVHYRSIAGAGYRCLTRGQHVAFEIHHRAQGAYALNVRPDVSSPYNQDGTP